MGVNDVNATTEDMVKARFIPPEPVNAPSVESAEPTDVEENSEDGN